MKKFSLNQRIQSDNERFGFFSPPLFFRFVQPQRFSVYVVDNFPPDYVQSFGIVIEMTNMIFGKQVKVKIGSQATEKKQP